MENFQYRKSGDHLFMRDGMTEEISSEVENREATGRDYNYN
jgi:hypothetical protein